MEDGGKNNQERRVQKHVRHMAMHANISQIIALKKREGKVKQ